MPRIMDEDIATVRERARIEEVVGSYLRLRRSGSDWQGLCPFHDEKTPSFHVTPARGLYYCFGCGVGGNVFDFVMRHDNMTWVEAVQLLADR
ncbi:MAG: DNA primase, partial [Propionibacteriaceae bacterium]|nr:DNA primase [Propionibacteriaceae bacterium]